MGQHSRRESLLIQNWRFFKNAEGRLISILLTVEQTAKGRGRALRRSVNALRKRSTVPLQCNKPLERGIQILLYFFKEKAK